MKKIYMIPQVEVDEMITTQNMIATSIPVDENPVDPENALGKEEFEFDYAW